MNQERQITVLNQNISGQDQKVVFKHQDMISMFRTGFLDAGHHHAARDPQYDGFIYQESSAKYIIPLNLLSNH